jgi:hypothetical protein
MWMETCGSRMKWCAWAWPGLQLSEQSNDGRADLSDFGDDWHTDFTVSIAPENTDLFQEAGIDLLYLAGQRVRIRG